MSGEEKNSPPTQCLTLQDILRLRYKSASVMERAMKINPTNHNVFTLASLVLTAAHITDDYILNLKWREWALLTDMLLEGERYAEDGPYFNIIRAVIKYGYALRIESEAPGDLSSPISTDSFEGFSQSNEMREVDVDWETVFD